MTFIILIGQWSPLVLPCSTSVSCCTATYHFLSVFLPSCFDLDWCSWLGLSFLFPFFRIKTCFISSPHQIFMITNMQSFLPHSSNPSSPIIPLKQLHPLSSSFTASTPAWALYNCNHHFNTDTNTTTITTTKPTTNSQSYCSSSNVITSPPLIVVAHCRSIQADIRYNNNQLYTPVVHCLTR